MKHDNLENRIKGGLAELPPDARDFSHAAVFGAVRADKLPEIDFVVSPAMVVRDQGDSDMCTAFATAAASEDQEGVLLDPAFTFYATKALVLKDTESWGADLRSACKSHQAYGALEAEFAPIANATRDQALQKDLWDEDHMALAYEHRKMSFFAIDGPHDIFDNIRSALWMNRMKMQSIVTGAKWRPSWTAAEGGVIPKEYEDYGTPHAFVIKGQKRINGELYLVLQLSNGNDIGDKGIFYMPREVANKELKYGCFAFNDIPKEKALNYLYYGTKPTDSVFTKWAKVLWRIAVDKITK